MKTNKLLKYIKKNNIINTTNAQFALSINKKEEPITTLAIICVHQAIIDGHVCLPINENKKLFYSKYNNTFIIHFLKYIKTKKIENLLNKNIIGNGSYPTPLVLFKNSLYLYKTWKSEQSISNYFKNPTQEKKYTPYKIKKVLTKIFNQKFCNLQKIAVAISILYKNTFIIGGPGTGKTTVVSKIILSFIRLSEKFIKIKLAAPTGKAAIRLTESLKHNLKRLDITTQEKLIFPSKTITLHKLLKINSKFQEKILQDNELLDLDILIIDESSMIDIYIMEQLIKKLPKHSKLILIGDFNQLPSIQPGNILKDICQHANNKYSIKTAKILKYFINYEVPISNCSTDSNLKDNICILKKNYRFIQAPHIKILSQLILKNNDKNHKKLFNNSYKNVIYNEIYNICSYENMINTLTNNYENYWQAIYNKKELKQIIYIFNKYRILCAVNKGLFGTNRINKNIELNMQHKKYIHNNINLNNSLYVGKPILITKSNKALKLLNGDIGILMLDDVNQHLKAFFLLPNNSINIIPVQLLTHYQTAWCMTIHKSQGSEFNTIAIILPNKYSKLCTKELIYTAITRAKKKFLYIVVKRYSLKRQIHLHFVLAIYHN
ncbi:exonuclease V subunit alpha [Buchnera aphidicola (Nipponaphis monzeni)]|uniref:RecBCD enzyme subunit RecD n=1 Tax=Buchnera aphidicola (Nipponaphis monzeni) TaxID=2495405 RepID=A0A455TAK4_9GAMM|nr:exodeoxyribonuclease V subunit alpha [Buchnera aphidicola]BBI01349.1 exonuclease V subunit alpha [Buchnera aphidicola (Nipponaphis monzeni)]